MSTDMVIGVHGLLMNWKEPTKVTPYARRGAVSPRSTHRNGGEGDERRHAGAGGYGYMRDDRRRSWYANHAWAHLRRKQRDDPPRYYSDPPTCSAANRAPVLEERAKFPHHPREPSHDRLHPVPGRRSSRSNGGASGRNVVRRPNNARIRQNPKRRQTRLAPSGPVPSRA